MSESSNSATGVSISETCWPSFSCRSTANALPFNSAGPSKFLISGGVSFGLADRLLNVMSAARPISATSRIRPPITPPITGPNFAFLLFLNDGFEEVFCGPSLVEAGALVAVVDRYWARGVTGLLRYVCTNIELRAGVCHPATGDVRVAPPSVLYHRQSKDKWH
jgi:hypothetical protein